MNRFYSLRPVIVMLAALGILTVPASASAGERPFRVRGTAHFLPDSTDFVGAGKATHLGKYTEVGSAVISGTDPAALEVNGWAILTAANGDELWVVITGHLNFFTGTITATDTYVGGTGRFEDASGSGTLIAQMRPDGTFAVNVKGRIDY